MRKLSLATDQISKWISGTPTWRPTLSVVPENLFAYCHHIYRYRRKGGGEQIIIFMILIIRASYGPVEKCNRLQRAPLWHTYPILTVDQNKIGTNTGKLQKYDNKRVKSRPTIN